MIIQLPIFAWKIERPVGSVANEICDHNRSECLFGVQQGYQTTVAVPPFIILHSPSIFSVIKQ